MWCILKLIQHAINRSSPLWNQLPFTLLISHRASFLFSATESLKVFSNSRQGKLESWASFHILNIRLDNVLRAFVVSAWLGNGMGMQNNRLHRLLRPLSAIRNKHAKCVEWSVSLFSTLCAWTLRQYTRRTRIRPLSYFVFSAGCNQGIMIKAWRHTRWW